MSYVEYIARVPIFTVSLLPFAGVALLTFVIQLWIGVRRFSIRGFLDHCFPFEAWKAASAHIDVKIFVIRKLTDRFLDFLSLAPFTVLATLIDAYLMRRFPGYVAKALATQGVILFCIITFVTSEFADYVTHYTEHKVPVLWDLHKIHHAAEFLSPFTAKREHPLAFVYQRVGNSLFTAVPAGIFMFTNGLSIADTLLFGLCVNYVGYVMTLGALKHSHFPVNFGWLDRIFASPHMHQIHHSSLPHHWDRNYGINLSIFDWIFGTAYQPHKGEVIVYGLAGETPEQHAAYHSMYGSYLKPFADIGRRASRRVASSEVAT